MEDDPIRKKFNRSIYVILQKWEILWDLLHFVLSSQVWNSISLLSTCLCSFHGWSVFYNFFVECKHFLIQEKGQKCDDNHEWPEIGLG